MRWSICMMHVYLITDLHHSRYRGDEHDSDSENDSDSWKRWWLALVSQDEYMHESINGVLGHLCAHIG